MLKKLVLLLAALVVSISSAFAAAVDVNTADQQTLESLKGIGPVKSKAIIDERTKNGPFKDEDDLAKRVNGLGAKSVAKLKAEGLTVGGSSAPSNTAAGKPAPSARTQPSAAASSAHATDQGASSPEAKSKKKRKGKTAAASGV